MRGITGFSGRQLATLLALVGLVALLVPVGARAAGQLVTITDADSLNEAVVDSNGSLQVTNGKLPLSVRDVGQKPTPYRATSATGCGGPTCTEFFPPTPGGRRWEVLSISAMVIQEDADRAYARCFIEGAAIGQFFVLVPMQQIDSHPNGILHNVKTFGGIVSTDFVVPAGQNLACRFLFQGGTGPSANNQVAASGYLLP